MPLSNVDACSVTAFSFTKAIKASSATSLPPPEITRSHAAAEVEGRLVQHVIVTLQQSPGIHRIEAQLLIHGAGEAAAPFEREGFHRYPRLFMKMPLRQPLPIPGKAAARRYRNPPLERPGLSSRRQPYYRRLSRPHRCRHQRSVPHHDRLAALPEQHHPLPRMRHLRRGFFIRRRPSPDAHQHRAHSLLAGQGRYRPRHPGMPACPNTAARESAST